MYEKIERMIARCDYHTAEKMIEKHRAELSKSECQALQRQMVQRKQETVKQSRKNRWSQRWERAVRSVGSGLFFFSLAVMLGGLLIGIPSAHRVHGRSLREWRPPSTIFFGNLSITVLGIGALLFGIAICCDKDKKGICWMLGGLAVAVLGIQSLMS